MKRVLLFLFAFCSAFVTAQTFSGTNKTINTGEIRFGNGSQLSVNSSGNVLQPFYYSTQYNGWRKLTYSSYPLDYEFGVGGDGTSEWNRSGAIVQNPTMSNQVFDDSGFVLNSGSTTIGYGILKVKGTISVGTARLEVTNEYNTNSAGNYLQVTTTVKNVGTSAIDNVRFWIGTRDDYVGGTDRPTKTKGNLVNGAFEAITAQSQRAAAVLITTSDEGVLFFSTSDRGNTSHAGCCSFTNSSAINPTTSAITRTGDGSYAYFVRMNDLAVGESDSFTWFYAAASITRLNQIITEVANASSAVTSITTTNALLGARSTVTSTGYYVVVPQGSTAPTAAQIKAGVDYGSVTVVDSGSGAMTANVQRSFTLSNLVAETTYDTYFVAEDTSVTPAQFSTITSATFTTDGPPVVTTSAPSSITRTSVTLAGNVTSDGGDPVTDRGIVYSSTSTPTVSDTKVQVGTSTGAFTTNISGLTPDVTYFARAYAINSVGTSYGAQVSFRTSPPLISSFSPTLAGQGETVVITGTGLTAATSVKFGNVNALSYTVDSDTQITAVVGAASSGDVFVQTSIGSDTETGFTFKVVEYNFNGNVLDETDANKDGVINGSVTYGVGAEGQSVCFDRGSNNWITLPNNLIRNESEFTISMRFKTTDKGVMLGYQNNVVNSSSANQYIPILVVQSNGTLRSTLWTTANRDMTTVSSQVVNDGNWHKVDMAISPTSIYVYLDGVLAGSTTSGTVAHLSMIYNQIGRGRTDASRDSSGGNLTGWQGFTGCIDNFVIIDRSLTLSEINEATSLPSPTISSLDVNTAEPGDTVVITGTNFTGATQVTFGGVSAASYTVNSATQITAVVGNDAASGAVSVVTAGGSASISGFTFDAGVSTITNVAPSRPVIGSTITITGTNFTNVTSVQIGTVSLTFTIVDATTITAVVPSEAISGTIQIVTPNGTYTGTTVTVLSDLDGDGIPDETDPDIDGDGILNDADADADGDGVVENGPDTDGDGINNANDPDIDGDGILNDADADADGDGVVENGPDTDGDGINDANDPDIDGDGILNDADADADGDGVVENGPDFDGDGINDANDPDIDGDGVLNADDPNDYNTDSDGDGIPDGADADIDGDGVLNPGVVDTDGDGIPDYADADADGDGVIDAGRVDTDGDGIIDAYDPMDNNADDDGDGIPNGQDADVDGDGVVDNGLDTDGDGVNNANDPDMDGDGQTNEHEIACGSNPLLASSKALDTDGDNIPNCVDSDDDGDGVLDSEEAVCGSDPLDADDTPIDTDRDGNPDCIDADDDGDGILDAQDAFPLDGTEWADADGDGIGNNADTDDDNDGFSDADEIAVGTDPLDADDVPADGDGDGIPDALDNDWDNDGVTNDKDAFPLDATETMDTDGDGIGDNADMDDDNDGISDSDEVASGTNPKDANSKPRDQDGDGIPDALDADIDGDGVANAQDAFPYDRTESVDTDGDGLGNNLDPDDDNDGVLDANDANPLSANSGKDTDGDGVADEQDNDVDNDGFADDLGEVSGFLSPQTSGIESKWVVANIKQYPLSRVAIYDRNGNEVFSAVNYQNDWDGTYKDTGKRVPAGPYLYRITLVDGTKAKEGWVYIIY